MSEIVLTLLGVIGGLICGIVGYHVWLRLAGGTLPQRVSHVMSEAEAARDQLLRETELDVKQERLQMLEQVERDTKRLREDYAATGQQLRIRELNIERKNEQLDHRERSLKDHETAVREKKQEGDKFLKDAEERLATAQGELERVAGMSAMEAHRVLVDSIQDEAREEAAVRVREVMERAREEADQQARWVVASAIQRMAGGFVSEKTISVVKLPSDDMKGRIIGREGRNIRAIEAATGVDVIIDDTPEVVILSAFNPVRRETARLALERLVADGRIHPARIEEVVESVRDEVATTIVRAGEKATFDLNIHGLHPELVRLVGTLKFRLIDGQNLWNHAVETAALIGMMASELGLDTGVARRAGLLHQIGRAVAHEVEGKLVEVGSDHARRFGEKPVVVEAIRCHRDENPESILGVLLQAASRLSASRPGAQRELMDNYIKRLSALEEIGRSFEGVEEAYVMQAGTEIRVMVNYGHVSEDDALVLSEDIARKIENELTYPGEVRVTVIREARATEIAR